MFSSGYDQCNVVLVIQLNNVTRKLSNKHITQTSGINIHSVTTVLLILKSLLIQKVPFTASSSSPKSPVFSRISNKDEAQFDWLLLVYLYSTCKYGRYAIFVPFDIIPLWFRHN